jgi:hypothetical protein
VTRQCPTPPATQQNVGIYAGGGLVINAYDATHGVIVERLTTWAPEVVDIRHVTSPGGSPELRGLQ